MRIAFRPFDDGDLDDFRSWFEDAELRRRLSYPTDEWLAYVTSAETGRCWVAHDATGQMIAALQIDNGKDGRGYLDIALRPDLRGRRLGVAVLSAFISGPGSEFKVLEGAIEPDNAASLACVRRCGFQIFLGLDEDGLVRVERYREDVDPQGREPTCVP